MPILDIQVRLRELGRIRTGDKAQNGAPRRLESFRLTSPSQTLLDVAAGLYGGEVRPWESPAGRQFELLTSADVLPIVIPPGQSMSQWYELWSGGGCQRRCDGQTEQIGDQPCLCPDDSSERREEAAKGRACKPTTRVNVILPDLPDLGVWRLESHGYYAAVELAGAAQFLAMASASGMNIPANLRLDQRERKVPGKPVNRYAVPVIEFTTTRITDLLAATGPAAMLGDGSVSQVQHPTLSTGKPRRGERVERPDMGPAPDLPESSDFARPAAPAPVAHPPAVGGWPVDDAPTEPVGLSKKDFAAELKERGISTEYATETRKRLFPDLSVDLTPAQRQQLLLAVIAEDEGEVA